MKLEIQLEPDLMAGQMVVGSFSGKELPSEVAKALSQGHLSGVILFAENLGAPEEVRGLTDSIREAAALPPIIAIDQEGGRVQRLNEPFTVWPPMRTLGERNDTRHAREVAKAMAAELLAVGINTDLAPVLDVDSNPDNPVIGDRSFSSESHDVSRLGGAMIEGFREAGIICCGKHFPGHGDTSEDSHHDLPVIEIDRATLDRRELLPFHEAIVAKAPMIMTAHVKAIALDPYYPATISYGIINDLLRQEMGFDGVVVTDDLSMGALSKYMPLEDAAYSSVKAGADLVLVCSGPDHAEIARATIVEGLKKGALDFGQTTMSVRRILSIKEEYLLNEVPPKDAIADLVGCDKHRKLAGA